MSSLTSSSHGHSRSGRKRRGSRGLSRGEAVARSEMSLTRIVGGVVSVGLVVVAPWLFGGVQTRVQVGLLIGLIVAIGCWLIWQWRSPQATFRVPRIAVSLVLLLVIGMLQLVPLPATIGRRLSPGAARLRAELQFGTTPTDTELAGKLDVVSAVGSQPLSLYPAGTRKDLALLASAIGVLLLGACLFGTPLARLCLCWTIAINGAAVALFGIVQQLTWNGKIFWIVPAPEGSHPFGPFVNRNNAAGYLNLCLAGGVAVLIWSLMKSSGYSDNWRQHCSARDDVTTISGTVARSIAALLDPRTFAAIILVGCITCGIFCAQSRAGILSMLASLIVVAVAIVRTSRQALTPLVLGATILIGAGLVAWVGMDEKVLGRLGTLTDQQEMAKYPRWAHWAGSVHAIPEFSVLGSGLGTYRYVYRPFQQTPGSTWYYHAENHYLELLIEAGMPGLLLILIGAGLMALAVMRLLRNKQLVCYAFGAAGGVALISQMVHAGCDFGMYIPSNLFLFALFCGALASSVSAPTGTLDPAERATTSRPRWRGWDRLSLVVPATLIIACTLGLWETANAAQAERLLAYRFDQEHISATDVADLTQHAEGLARLASSRPDDLELHTALAKLHQHLFRVQAFNALRSSSGKQTPAESLWQVTLPVVLHAQLYRCATLGPQNALAQLRNDPVVQKHLLPALRHWILACRACCLSADPHLGIAALVGLVSDVHSDRPYIARAQIAAPADPRVVAVSRLLTDAAKPQPVTKKSNTH